MALVSVVLNGSDHVCCGPHRQVGDTVTMQIHNDQGRVYEERHPDAVSIATQPMSGTIVRIEWRPVIMREETTAEGYTLRTPEGYGPGIGIESTEYDDPNVADADWAFQFTVETDDPIPEPRKV